MIEVKHIAVRKGGKTIISDISFTVKPGKITVVVGKNGAGKSTLLETLSGANPLSEGEIFWEHQPYSTLSPQQLATLRAVLSQQVTLGFPLTVNELVEMGTYVSPHHLSRLSIRKFVRQALTKVELPSFGNRDFTSLSGGEQKRVLLAKCMVQLNCCQQPGINQYLFLDEPTASLDIQQQHKLISWIKEWAKQRNLGIFAILHDLNLVAQFADEILIMNSGRMVARGTPEEVLTPEILLETMDIHALVQPHPVFTCPHITTLPESLELHSQ